MSVRTDSKGVALYRRGIATVHCTGLMVEARAARTGARRRPCRAEPPQIPAGWISGPWRQADVCSPSTFLV